MRKIWIAGLLIIPCLYGTDKSFTFIDGSQDGGYPWGDDSNWTPGPFPTAVDNATIDFTSFDTSNPRVLVQSDANPYATCLGLTIVAEGAVYIQNDQSSLPASLTINGGLFDSDGMGGICLFPASDASNALRTLTLLGTTSSTYQGSLYGSGTFNISLTSGAFTMTGNGASFSGPTNLTGGTFNANYAAALSPTSQYVFSDTSGVILSLGADNTAGSLAGGGSGTNGVIYLNGNTLTVGTDGKATTYSGIISHAGSAGTGYLNVTGGGALTLNNTSTYTGSTSIGDMTIASGVYTGGTLAIQSPGALTGSLVYVGSGGTLKGNGSITNTVTVYSGGTISPGMSIGTLTISSGNLVLEPGSTTNIEVNAAGGHSAIHVTHSSATAALAGTLFIQVDPGTYSSLTSYTGLITASSITGAFNSVVAYGFKTIVNNTGTSYNLELIPINFHNIAFTGNAKAVGSYLLSLRFLPFMQQVLADLYALTDPQLAAAINLISPSRNSFSTFAAANTSFTITNTLSDRLASQRQLHAMKKRSPAMAAAKMSGEAAFLAQNEPLSRVAAEFADNDEMERKPAKPSPYGSSKTLAREEFKYDVWIQGLGEFAHQNAESQNPDFNFNTGGALFGFDCMGNRGQIGAAIGYSYTGINDGGNAGNATVQFVAASLYGDAYFDEGYLELALLSGYNHYTNDRHIFFPGFDAHAKSSHDGSSCTPRIAGGYDFDLDWATIEPFGSVDCAFIFQNKFNEYGAGSLNMKQSRSMSELLRAEVGAHFYEDWMWESWVIILKEKLSYIYQKGFGLGTLSSTAIVGAPDGFTVTTFTKNQNLFSPAFELFVKWEDRWFFSADYEGEFGSGYTTNEVRGQLGYYF